MRSHDSASSVWTPATGVGAQSRALPIVGVVRGTPAAGFDHVVVALREGLAEAGLVDGRDVSIVLRWADNDLARLPGLAAELGRGDRRQQPGGDGGEVRGARSSVRVRLGGRPGEARSGRQLRASREARHRRDVLRFGQIGAKRFELLAEAVPRADVFGFLRDLSWDPGSFEAAEVQAVASRTGHRLLQATADHAGEGVACSRPRPTLPVNLAAPARRSSRKAGGRSSWVAARNSPALAARWSISPRAIECRPFTTSATSPRSAVS